VQKWCNFRARVRGDERAIPGGRQNHGWAESLGVPVILDFRFSNFEFRISIGGRRGEKFVSPYMGETGGKKAFGDKLLEQRRLRQKLRFLRRQKWRRRLKNIFANLCKSLEINGIFFGACPDL